MFGNCINTIIITSSLCVFNTNTHRASNLDTNRSLCFLHAPNFQVFKKISGQTYEGKMSVRFPEAQKKSSSTLVALDLQINTKVSLCTTLFLYTSPINDKEEN